MCADSQNAALPAHPLSSCQRHTHIFHLLQRRRDILHASSVLFRPSWSHVRVKESKIREPEERLSNLTLLLRISGIGPAVPLPSLVAAQPGFIIAPRHVSFGGDEPLITFPPLTIRVKSPKASHLNVTPELTHRPCILTLSSRPSNSPISPHHPRQPQTARPLSAFHHGSVVIAFNVHSGHTIQQSSTISPLARHLLFTTKLFHTASYLFIWTCARLVTRLKTD